MAVYEHTYKSFTGATTPTWSRFLIIPRNAYRTVFQSKLFVMFFVLCYLPPLIMAIMVYLKHNVNALGIFQLQLNALIPIDGSFFYTFVWLQCYLSFFLAVLIGPPLISRDVENNGLPLYLARPLSRAEYVIGKMSVLLILTSLVTWVPGLLLFGFEAYLEGWSWFTEHLAFAGAIYFGCFLWIVFISLLTLAVSAWVKWRVVASGILVGLFFIPRVLVGMISVATQTNYANLLSIPTNFINIWQGLFGIFARDAMKFQYREGGKLVDMIWWEPPLWGSWAMIAFFGLICLTMLYLKVRAYEVVR
jgi:ABC-2 type transport system permease protein